MTRSDTYWVKPLARRVSRRRALSLAGTSAFALAAAACSNNSNNATTVASSAASATRAAVGASPAATAAARLAATAAPAAAKPGGTLNIGYATRPASLAPPATTFGDDANFLYAIGDPLIAYKSDGSPSPDASLAQSFNYEDPTTLVLNLRTGVKFHDGTDFNASAAKASLEYVIDPKNKFSYAGQYKSIQSIEAPDDHTLRLKLAQPDATLVSNLGQRGAIMMSPTALQKLGPDFNSKPQLTGPYKVREWIPGSHFTIDKNPDYWRKGVGFLDSIVFQEIPDDRVRLAAIQSGNVSLASITAGDMSVQAKGNKELQLLQVSSGTTMIDVNHALAPLTDLRVRQALAYAIDKGAELASVWQGVGQVANGSLIPPGGWGYADCSDIAYKFDVAKAKQMLQAAGVPTPVQLKFICGSDPSDRVATAQLVKGFLEDVGFKINLDIIDRAQALSTALDPKTSYHLYSTGAGVRPDPGGTLDIYLTKDSYYNPGKTSDDPVQQQLNELVKAGGSSTVQADRQKAYVQAQRLAVQNVMGSVPLIYNVAIAAVRPNVKGADSLWSAADVSWRLTGLSLA